MIYLLLFLEFFKIGLFTFGGGYAMIPLVRETVVAHSWLTEEAFYDLIGICESTPGPIAINMATYVGSIQGGIFGSICATLGVVLPSYIIILLIAAILTKFINNPHVQKVLSGIKYVVVGLILSSGIILVLKCFGFISLGNFTLDLASLVIFCTIGVMYMVYRYIFPKKKMPAIVIILLAAILGILFTPFLTL
ncbi:MAG: chromate transporter [Bacilli bacterium]|nr:chromate transporter [Bacilli bacterium]